MSWDSYIDNVIGHGQGNVDKVAICGLDGSTWTTEKHQNALKLTTEEVKTISHVLKTKDFTPFQSGGVVIEGTKYQFLREEDQVKVYAKKKDHGAITVEATNTGCIIAHCPEGKQAGTCNKAVGTVAEYLKSLNM